MTTCFGLRSKKENERAAGGKCPYLCKTCVSSSRRCEDCGAWWCTYHFPRHIPLYERRKSDFDPEVDPGVFS
jgi:hypothetical protein